jgi:citrate synthase
MLLDKEQEIARPRQIYVGAGMRASESRLSDKQPHTRKDSIRK